MSGLAEALAVFAPEAEPLDGNRIREMGRAFAIEKRRRDEVVGVRLDAPVRRAGAGRRCDGLFLCRPEGEARMTPVYVELKGTDTTGAIDQIEWSADAMCKGRSRGHRVLRRGRIDVAAHDGRVLGLVISARGLSLKQQRRKRLHRRGLVLRIVSRAKGRPVKRSCQTLHTWLHGTTDREASR